MSAEKCFCHLNGYKVKDADARAAIERFDIALNRFTGTTLPAMESRIETIENDLQNPVSSDIYSHSLTATWNDDFFGGAAIARINFISKHPQFNSLSELIGYLNDIGAVNEQNRLLANGNFTSNDQMGWAYYIHGIYTKNKQVYIAFHYLDMTYECVVPNIGTFNCRSL